MAFKVTDLGINSKPVCDFLFVNNSNLHLICHRFQDTAVIGEIYVDREGASL